MGLQNTQNLIADFCRDNTQSILLKQYEKNSRFIIVKCTENGVFKKLDKGTMTCNIKVLTPDDRAIYDPCEILDDGTVKVSVSESMVYAAGVAKAELNIFDDSATTLLATMVFNFIIKPSAYSDDKIISSDEFSALTELITKAEKDYTYIIEETKKISDDAKVSAINAKTYMDNASTYANTASEKAIEASNSAENASNCLNSIEIKTIEIKQIENDVAQMKSDVSSMKSNVTLMQEKVAQDKTDIDETIKNSLLASSEEILATMKDYYDRAQQLYNSMYIDCDGETPQQRVVTIVSIDCGTPQSRLHDNNGILFNGGTPLNRQLAS
mgnify:FL=1